MKDYQVSDYSILSNAQATTKSYIGKLGEVQSGIAESKQIISNTAVFMGPVQENCMQEFASLDADYQTIVTNFNTLGTFIGTTSENYQAGDKDAQNTVLTATDNKDANAQTTANTTANSTVTNKRMSIPSDPAIAAKKQEWLGDVDDKSRYTYYQGNNLYSRRNVLEIFDNTTGETWRDDGGSITLKPGETRVLTVKLPTDTGMINQITRTTADGSGAYRTGKIVTARSDIDPDPNNVEWVRMVEGVNHKPSNMDLLHNNSYDWIITANNEGSVTASQTVLWSTDQTKGRNLKAMIDVKVNVQK